MFCDYLLVFRGPWNMPLTVQKKRRVLCVIGAMDRGGTEMHLSWILPRLAGQGYDITIFTLHYKGSIGKLLEEQGFRVISPWFPSDGKLRGWPGRVLRLLTVPLHLLFFMLLRRPELVHFFLPASYLVGGPLAILARIPLKVMSRRSLNHYQKGKPALIPWMERRLHPRMQAVLGNSRKVVAQLSGEEGAPEDRTALLYNGIPAPDSAYDRKIERQKTREKLGISPDCIAMAIVANLIPYKGHSDLLEACSRLNRDRDWHLFIIGHDSRNIEAVLRAQASEAGIADRVSFLGARRDITNLLSGMDIGILASHEEGFSNAILEGMQAALPMVVTDVGGNGEAVLNGDTGFVVPAKDPAAMSEAIEQLLSDDGLRNRMGQAGKSRVEQCFTLDVCVQGYVDLYESLFTGIDNKGSSK